MNTLVIYDSTGYILFQGAGSVREPAGIPFIWAEIPEGKRIISINTKVTPNVAVLEDTPKSVSQQKLEDLTLVVADLIGGVE